MGFWSELLGGAPPPAPAPAASAAIEPATVPIMPRRGTAAWHRDRFANALPQYRVALERGETTPERIAELERQLAYYTAIAAAEEAAGIEAVDPASEEGND